MSDVAVNDPPTPSRTKPSRNANFWRACGYLGPYRGLVAVSIGCALMVGLVFTSGLGAMLPIFKVLLDDQTIAGWVDRQIVEKRLGVSFDDDLGALRISKVMPDKPAARAGLEVGDAIVSIAGQQGIVQHPEAYLIGASGDVTLAMDDASRATVTLPPPSRYLLLAHGVARRFPANPIKAIAAVFGIVFCLALFGSVVRFFQEHLSDRAAFYAINDVRAQLYNHVLHVPMTFFGLRGTSDVTSRLVQDCGQLQEGFKTVLGQSIQEPIKAALALGLSLYVSWQLTLFIILFAPLMAVLIRKFGKRMRRVSRKAMQESSTMLGQIEGTLAGIRVVKAARSERFERRRYRAIMRELIAHQVRLSRIDAMSSPILETLTLLVVGAVVMYAAYLVKVAGTLEKEYFFLVMACLMMIAESLRKVSKVNNQLQRANAAAGRIFEILDIPVEQPRRQPKSRARQQHVAGDGDEKATEAASSSALSLRKLPPLQREIRFEHVTFRYPNSSTPALLDVDLTVPKGRSIAVVGRNGSGKTTLLALLPRFYDPQGGRVTIDGVDVRGATLASLRNQITIVTQDPIIFPGTIASNIAYGQPRAGRDEIIEAAKRAFAHEFILEKPDGYDTVLGELGGQLSGGQKQRLCIARAILRRTPILILDEATSQVDAESEHLIQRAIEALIHERTTFVIAHRFSTITSADEIIVMDRGRIVARGQHEQLLRGCETYQQLYERQLFAPSGSSAGSNAGAQGAVAASAVAGTTR